MGLNLSEIYQICKIFLQNIRYNNKSFNCNNNIKKILSKRITILIVKI
jgi:hypothetical protein